MIAIGKTIMLRQPAHDLSGEERSAGMSLVVEQVAHEHTRYPIILATPVEWTRHAITHRTLHTVSVDGQYCFYLDDLYEATAV